MKAGMLMRLFIAFFGGIYKSLLESYDQSGIM